jgi:hypothetical protein
VHLADQAVQLAFHRGSSFFYGPNRRRPRFSDYVRSNPWLPDALRPADGAARTEFYRRDPEAAQ